MRRGMRIADFLTAHARIAFDLMQSDHVARGARHILAWLERTGAESFAARDAYRASRTRVRAPAEMDPALDLLVDHEVIRRRPAPPRFGPGRPPSPMFDVNPAIHGQNTQNSVAGPWDRGSVNSVQGSGPCQTDSSLLPQVLQEDETGGF